MVILNEEEMDIVFYCTDKSATNVVIPDGVKLIKGGAFQDCTNLTSVTIPDSVTSIGISAFYKCTSLTSVEIPNSVTEIGDEAFYGCTSLTSVTISNSVTKIGNDAFADCKNLTSVEIPNSVTRIANRAFRGCESLTSITIPNSVTRIGEGAFKGSESLNVNFIGSREEFDKVFTSATGIYDVRTVTICNKSKSKKPSVSSDRKDESTDKYAEIGKRVVGLLNNNPEIVKVLKQIVNEL